MLIAPRQAAAVVATITSLFVPVRSHAGYMSANVPLDSYYAGANVGNVLAEANNETAVVNGLLPGQARLTFTINSVPAYTQKGSLVGFIYLGFFTDLKLTSEQITSPMGYSAYSHYGEPSFPAGFGTWSFAAPTYSDRKPTVSLLFSGLGSQATLDHFVTPVTILLPNSDGTPTIFGGWVGFPGPTSDPPVWGDAVYGNSVHTTPEPSAFALAAAGAVAIALASRKRITRG